MGALRFWPAALATVAALAAAPAAHAQEPIPEGSHNEPEFIGEPAHPQPVEAPPLAPQHPFLAPNGKSNIHNDAYMTDVYEGPGPLGRGTTRRDVFEVRDCASLTFDARGRIVTICVGLDRPVLVLKDPVTLATLASMPLPPRQPGTGNVFQDFSGGGYFYLDERDRAVVGTTDRHLYVVEQTPEPGFRLVRDVDLNGELAPDDKIVSVLPDWAGRLWFVTAAGVVGTVARDEDVVKVHDTGETISNSFSVDEDGGVYIVSDGALYRFRAGSDGSPEITWRVAYDNVGVQKPGQSSRGSGTTPTIGSNGTVAITDNADPMNVVVYERRTGAEICRAPVFERGASATDNSLIMAGTSIVVENNHGYTGPGATQNGRSTTPGVERVDYDLATRTCRKVWRSEERSPTVVPKLSLANGLVYVYTKEVQDDGDDVWYLTALDFRTGRTVFKAFAGEGLGHNNNYAPISLGPDGSAYVGVLGGLVRLADAEPPPGAAPRPAPSPPGDSRPLGRPCQPRSLTVSRLGIGLVLLGLQERHLRLQGARLRRRAATFCVAGGGRMAAALDRRRRVRLVVSTGPGHRYRGVGPRMATRRLRRAFPARRRVAPGVFAADPSRRVLFGVRARRVAWVAVARRGVTRRRASVRAALRVAGFGRSGRARASGRGPSAPRPARGAAARAPARPSRRGSDGCRAGR
ncbi:MAG TPA: hypothetical protein VHF89_13665 [Solirubrobacteraceae bacterium]|nr:hypothetical protein [Solirubrobacteraceae bacterium]